MSLSLFPGLARYNDYNLAVLSASAAVPFYNMRSTEHDDRIRLNNYKLTNHALDYAVHNESVEVVILTSVASPIYCSPPQSLRSPT